MKWRGTFRRLLVPVLAVVLLPAGAAAAGKILAVDPADTVLLVEEASEALCPWYQSGFRGLTLVHFGPKPPFHSPIADAMPDLAVLRGAIEGKACGDLRERISGPTRADSLYSAWDFAGAAHLLGVAKELWWVVPYRERIPKGDFADFKKWLRDTFGLPEEFLEGLEHGDGVVRGVYRGLPVRLTTLADLPALQGEVLLSVEAAYLAGLFENPVGTPLLDILAWFFSTTREKGLRGSHVVIAAGGDTLLKLRYLGGQLRELFADPRSFEAGPPEAWKRQREVDYLGYMQAYDKAAKAAAGLTALDGRPPGPWYDRAILAASEKKTKEAQRFLEEAIARDPAYAGGYPILAGILGGGGLGKEALALLREGWSRHPESTETGLMLADLISAMGEHAEAVGIAKELVDRHPTAPAFQYALTRFLLLAGRRAEAGQAMQRFRDLAPEGVLRRKAIEEWEGLSGKGVQ